MSAVPLYEPTRGLSLWDDEEIQSGLEVLRSRSLFRYDGPALLGRATELEHALAAATEVEHAVAVSSGTAALECGLVGLDLPPGSEVVVPAVTFVATVGAVVSARCVPVFAEVDETLCLDPATVADRITERTAAIVPVHLGNVAAAMDPLLEIGARHGLRILEDAAQATGVSYRGRPVGSLGTAGAFSFNAEKNVGVGEGGALVTSDRRVLERAEQYQDQGGQFTTGSARGRRDDVAVPMLGTNRRINELTAALALVQLRRLPAMLTALRRRALWIRAQLADVDLRWRSLPDAAGHGGDVTFFLSSRRAAWSVLRALRHDGVPASLPYGGKTVCANPAVAAGRTPWGAEFAPDPCPRSERLVTSAITVPLGATMTDAHTEQIVDSVRRAVAGVRGSSHGDRE